MKTFKNDKRSLRTRSVIKRAVFQLLREKTPEQITVSEVSKLADVSRNSFYTHYSAMTDVLEDIYIGIIKNIDDIIIKYDYQSVIEDPYPLLKDLTSPLIEYSEFADFITSSKNVNFFIQGFIDTLTERFYKVYVTARGENNPTMPYLINFLVAGVIEFVYKWYKDGCKDPFDNILKQVSILIKESVSMIRDVKKQS